MTSGFTGRERRPGREERLREDQAARNQSCRKRRVVKAGRFVELSVQVADSEECKNILNDQVSTI